jgi:hypothetical protein
MATVPQYEIGQVKDRAVSGGFQQIQTNPDAFGAGIAQAQIQQGQAISQLGDQAWQTAFQQRDILDQATLRERDNLLSAKIRELISDDGGYLSLSGRAAVDAKEGIEAQLAAYKKELAKDLDPRILGKYNQVADQRLSSAFTTIDGHNRTQTDAWNKDERVARIASAVQNTAANFGNPAAMKLELDLGLREVDSQLLDVWGIDASAPKDDGEKAIIAKQRLAFTTKAHEAVIANHLANNDYLNAQAHFDEHKGAIDATMYDDIERALQTHTRAGEVNSAVETILADGGSLKQQLAKARKIPDQTLANAVVQELKVREQEDQAQIQLDEAEALKRVNQQIANGATSRSQINPDDWAALSGTDQANLEDYFTQRINAEDAINDEIKREKEETAKNLVYGKLANNEEITTADLMAMSGTDYYLYTKEVEAKLLKETNKIHLDNYNIINAQIAIGKTYAEIQKSHSSEWDKMSGEAKRLMKTLLDTKAEKLEDDEQLEIYEIALRMLGDDFNTEIDQSVFNGMSAIQELTVRDKQQSLKDQANNRTYTAEARAEEAAYSKVLKHLVDGGTLENLEAGLWDQLNGPHQSSITTALDTSAAKNAKAQLDIDKQKNWLTFSQMAVNDWASFQKVDLSLFVGLLTDANHSKLVEMQLNQGSASLSGTREGYLKMVIGSLGYDYNADSIKKGDDGDDVRRFIAEVDMLVQAHFTQTGNDVNDVEYKAIVTRLLTDLVWNNKGKNEQEPLIMAIDEPERLFIKVNTASGKTEDVYLKDIPAVERATIIGYMKALGEKITEQGIAQHFFDASITSGKN